MNDTMLLEIWKSHLLYIMLRPVITISVNIMIRDDSIHVRCVHIYHWHSMCRESCFVYKSDSMILIKNGFNPVNHRSPNSNLTIGRVVKALDLKSNGLCPRRFEPCQLRTFWKIFSPQNMMPPVGFEPTTPSLRDWCSTTELKRHF